MSGYYRIRHKDSHETFLLSEEQYTRFFDNRDPREYVIEVPKEEK